MEEILYFSGEPYFKALIGAIDRAKYSVNLETYIFNIDTVGKQVINSLLNAANRGLQVKILVDGAGCRNEITELLNVLAIKCQVRIFHPLPWKLRHIIPPSLIRFNQLVDSFLKINVRNHRKTCIIDGEILFTGSFNITAQHTSYSNHLGWRDTGIRLCKTDLSDIQKAFQVAWKNTNYSEKIKNFFHALKNNLTLRINNTWYRRRILHKDLLKKIYNAKQRIWITNAYFVPDSALLKQLINASLRNVEVKILLPSRSDIAFMPWTAQTFYHQLIAAKIKIYEYLPTILHAKTLIIDNWMTIGSSNLNHRSLLHDLELDVVVQTSSAKKKLVEQFYEDLKVARIISLNDLSSRTWYQKFIGWVLLYLRYLI